MSLCGALKGSWVMLPLQGLKMNWKSQSAKATFKTATPTFHDARLGYPLWNTIFVAKLMKKNWGGCRTINIFVSFRRIFQFLTAFNFIVDAFTKMQPNYCKSNVWQIHVTHSWCDILSDKIETCWVFDKSCHFFAWLRKIEAVN